MLKLKPRLRKYTRHLFNGNQKGVSLLEVAISIALLGIITVTIFTALRGSTTALITADKRTTAESLARSEMEYLKNLPYSSGNYTLQSVPAEYSGYTITNPLVPVPVSDTSGPRVGLQKITISVYYKGLEVLTLEGYKAR